MAKTVTIRYFAGCPNHQLATARVAEALDRLDGPAAAVDLEEVPDQDAAERLDFRGSPTVLVDGVDPFAQPGAPPGFACRIYATPSGPDGAPTVEQLCAVLG